MKIKSSDIVLLLEGDVGFGFGWEVFCSFVVSGFFLIRLKYFILPAAAIYGTSM